jgi:hypothetical protein
LFNVWSCGWMDYCLGGWLGELVNGPGGRRSIGVGGGEPERVKKHGKKKQ